MAGTSESIDGSDIAHIAARLGGWKLQEPSEQGSSRWSFSKIIPDGRYLFLGIDISERDVEFREILNGNLYFKIKCRDIRRVNTPSSLTNDKVVFEGDVRYEITFEGMQHEVYISNASVEPIVMRSYPLDLTILS